MNFWRNQTRILMVVALVAFMLGAVTSEAALLITSTESATPFHYATDDLINLGSPTFASQANLGGSNYGSDATGIGLNNGTLFDGGTGGQTEDGKTYCPADGSSITFDLASPQDIYRISSISGGNQARRSQRWQLEFGTDGAFTTVANQTQIDFTSNAGNGLMQVELVDDAGAPLGMGVDQVRVTYANTGATLPETMYRELDVFPLVELPVSYPTIISANLTGHFDASNLNGDDGATHPGNGNDVSTWTNLVTGETLNRDVSPTFVAAGNGGIGDQDTVHFDATDEAGDLLFNNAMNVSAQTIFAVVSMDNNNAVLATLLCDKDHNRNLRQTTSDDSLYYSGNNADFLIHQSTAANGGTVNIDGNRRLDIPDGFGTAHVVKAERNSATTFNGLRISDNVATNRRWNGDVAEILMFDAKLSGDDTLRVQSYLTEKYGLPFNTALDERITESKQIALDPFDDESPLVTAVNFHYGGPEVTGTIGDIGVNNIDLASAGALAGTFALDANEVTSGVTLTLDLPFTSDNSSRPQNASITGPFADVLNTVADEYFYIGDSDSAHPSAGMTFDGLWPEVPVFVQVLGGDAGGANWISTVDVLVNDMETIEWLGVADNGTTTGTASLLGFYATPDEFGQLRLLFTSTGSDKFAGIAGIMLIQQVPEPGTFVLMGIGLFALIPIVRRRRQRR